jgi:hypothetical protein
MKLYGSGSTKMTRSGGIDAMVERVVRQSGGRVLDEMKNAADTLFQDAYRHWYDNIKKRSGKSRSGLGFGVRIASTTSLEAFVANSADYVWYIHYPWPNENKYVMNELVKKPGKKLATKLADDLREDLAKLARG